MTPRICRQLLELMHMYRIWQYCDLAFPTHMYLIVSMGSNICHWFACCKSAYFMGFDTSVTCL